MSTGFFARLARLASTRPELPWLFFRRDYDWRWRSHRQVADHLARAAKAMQEADVRAATGLPFVGIESLMAKLAALAAGATFQENAEPAPGAPFLTVRDAGWPELKPAENPGPFFELPAARGNIERYTLQSLPAGPFGHLQENGRSLSCAELEETSRELAKKLFAAEEGQPGQGQKIVNAGARLSSHLATALVMACCEPKTVLALEPYPDATVPSILWCRPTHLFATAEEIAALAEAFSPKDAKKSRLRRILVAGQPDPAWSAKLEVPVLGWLVG